MSNVKITLFGFEDFIDRRGLVFPLNNNVHPGFNKHELLSIITGQTMSACYNGVSVEDLTQTFLETLKPRFNSMTGASSTGADLNLSFLSMELKGLFQDLMIDIKNIFKQYRVMGFALRIVDTGFILQVDTQNENAVQHAHPETY